MGKKKEELKAKLLEARKKIEAMKQELSVKEELIEKLTDDLLEQNTKLAECKFSPDQIEDEGFKAPVELVMSPRSQFKAEQEAAIQRNQEMLKKGIIKDDDAVDRYAKRSTSVYFVQEDL